MSRLDVGSLAAGALPLAEQLLVDGHVTITGIWRHALDAVVIAETDGSPLCLKFRPSSWRCDCGGSDASFVCAHALAASLVAGGADGPLGRISEARPQLNVAGRPSLTSARPARPLIHQPEQET